MVPINATHWFKMGNIANIFSVMLYAVDAADEVLPVGCTFTVCEHLLLHVA